MLNYQIKTQNAVIHITRKGFRQIVVRFDSEFYTDTVVAFELIDQRFFVKNTSILCALLFSFNASICRTTPAGSLQYQQPGMSR